MADPIVVRMVTSEDLPALRALEDRTDDYVCDRRFTEAAGGSCYYIIAIRGTDPHGTVVLDVSEGEMQPELRNMYVYQHARRQGVGTVLDEFVQQLAHELGFKEVFLGVDPDNYRAVPLYVSLGYEPTGNHRLSETGVVEGVDSPDDKPVYHDAIYRKSLRYLD
ncbi:MAG: GNAT family N-acetyltransferase [Actinomycetia bacterium]|nr:GNAT family N-acetyltransferase [Actinomycetes bacterium]